MITLQVSALLSLFIQQLFFSKLSALCLSYKKHSFYKCCFWRLCIIVLIEWAILGPYRLFSTVSYQGDMMFIFFRPSFFYGNDMEAHI